MPIDTDAFRQTLGSFASGVTIVTSAHGDLRHGMTVSAFASVSLEPPLVLICADKSSNTHGVIRNSGVFSVSLLSAGQQELSNLFASKSREDVRFDGLDCVRGATGCPRIPGALAWLDCTVDETVEAGDHVVYIAAVEDVLLGEGEPLVYFRAGYRALT